jgi:3-keto-5-aminohexanoate cleavage enzyme
MDDILICVAPNGARLGKNDHASLPITPVELADCAQACAEAGAGMIHLHVRDQAQKHVLDGDGYREAMRAIRQRLGDDIVIQVTTEAVGRYRADEQRHLVKDVKPEAVSLALRELLPEDGDEKEFAEFWTWMQRERIWPQIILYSPEEVQRFLTLRARGLFGDDHVSLLCVLGRYGQQIAEPQELLPSYALLKDEKDLDWSVCAFGPNENACVTLSAILGGHIRVGFENNRTMPDGTQAPNNETLVSNAAHSSRLVGRFPMPAETLRTLYINR